MENKKGFTLMELMVVMSIFTLVSGIAYTALRLNDNYKDMIMVKNELYRNCKKAMDSMADELQKSRAFDIAVYGANPESIYFKIPLINSVVAPNFSVPWGGRYSGTDYPDRFIRYRLSGTRLLRGIINNNGTPLDDSDDTIEPGTQEEAIAEGIADLDFELAGNLVTVAVESRRTTLSGGQRPLTMSLTSQVYLRN